MIHRFGTTLFNGLGNELREFSADVGLGRGNGVMKIAIA